MRRARGKPARVPAGLPGIFQHEGGGPADHRQARRPFTRFDQTGGPASLGQARRTSAPLAYAQLSKALTFWPHIMPEVKASQMFPPPE